MPQEILDGRFIKELKKIYTFFGDSGDHRIKTLVKSTLNIIENTFPDVEIPSKKKLGAILIEVLPYIILNTYASSG